MKRYDVGICPNECPGPAMDLWEDGEWVRYEEAEAALAEEKRRTEKWKELAGKSRNCLACIDGNSPPPPSRSHSFACNRYHEALSTAPDRTKEAKSDED